MANSHSLDLESDSSQYAYATDSASLSITGSFTLECCVNFESLTTVDQALHILIAKYDVANNKRSYFFGMRNLGGVLNFAGNISTDGTLQTANQKDVPWTPSTGTWYHVAMVYDNTVPNYKFYVNAALQGTAQTVVATSIHNNDSQLRIGALQDTSLTSYLLDGKIDEVRIWNYARTAAQISEFKDRQIITPYPGLMACYNLNNSTADSSGNGNTLTLVASPSYSTTIPTLADYSKSNSLFFAQL